MLLTFSTEEKPSFLPNSSPSDLFEGFMTSPMPLLFFNVCPMLFISLQVSTELASDGNLAARHPVLYMALSST